jgi:HlyD family secretion protein
LAELVRGPREETIRESRAQLEATRSSARNAATNRARVKELFARDLSNQFNLDLATTRSETTIAAEQAASESLNRLLNGTTVEKLDQAIAALKAAEAAINRIQLDIDRLKIHAPVNGMLDKRLYQLGERPQIGATVTVILDSARTYARIYVPEPLRASVQPGKRLVVRLDGNNAVSYEPFMEGFLDQNQVLGRPVDLLIAPDGALLVSDDQRGVIYRIFYARP